MRKRSWVFALLMAIFVSACSGSLEKGAQNTNNIAEANQNKKIFDRWQPLHNDQLHDIHNPGIKDLQEPGHALAELPMDYSGNKVNWIKALREGIITPRASLYEATSVNTLNLDIVMQYTAGMPMVLFPHQAHTEWLDCQNCHNEIFIPKVDANPINMFAILQGEYCGRCHGAVAFPLTECNRCHSLSRRTFVGEYGAQYQTLQQEPVLSD